MTSANNADDPLTPHQRRELGNTGIYVSPLGFGAATLGNEFGPVEVTYSYSGVYRDQLQYS